MSVRADNTCAPLKAKQKRLLDVIRSHGPISVRSITSHIHGDDTQRHVLMVHAQTYSLRDRGLIKPAHTGEREHGRRGVRPLLWVAVEVQA